LKFFPKAAGAALLIAGGCFAARAELTKWAEGISAGNRLEAVFFRSVLLPTGSVPVRRPPKETRQALTTLIGKTANDAELYSLRALEAEQQLDFTAAELDWKKYAETAADQGASRLALADFYHRRIRAREEFNTLIPASFAPAPASEKLLPVREQRPWKTFQRSIDVVEQAQLDPLLAVGQYTQWIARYPAQKSLYRNFFAFLMSHELYDIAGEAIASYKKAVPADEEFPLEATAELLAKTGSPARALEVYDRSFQPLWPDSLVKQYFDLLKQSNGLRAYLEKARAGVAANPTDLASAARIFHYWKQQNNLPPADRALAEFRQRKESKRSAWTSQELLTLARLYESSHNYDEAARNYYALYSKADASASTALAGLAQLLLSAPEQSIRFGSGNLTMYRDVATMDPHPGFLNGALSLIFNSTNPRDHYEQEELSAGPYFRRARAADLVALFESRFPNAPERADLRERVIEAYAVHGASDAVIRAGTKFLTDFPNAPNRTSVALRVADAYARTNQTAKEFALYDALLIELAKRADNIPLGALPAPKPARPENGPPMPQYDALRSPDYARVLDRCVARLVSLKRTRDALAIYRREIDRNPSDPGLYDTLAAFLEQNDMGAEIEAVYQRAIAQFQDHSWQHKLARWYLREKRQADVARLTRDVVKIFSGTELDGYFREIVTPGRPVGPALYLQLNLYAHQRFPHYLQFARNLLAAYSTPPTADNAAFDAILRRHWYDAEDLRMRFFERLSRTGRLDAELSLIRTSNPAASAGKWDEAVNQSPAAVRLLAEGEAWRCHFESAAPMFSAVESLYPADRAIGVRTAALYRSLGTLEPSLTDTAVAVEEKLNQADPRDRQALTAIGEIEADREHFEKARAAWDRLAQIEPAKPDGYLEAATVFWDYYRYDDALRLIEEGRKRLKQDSLFAYEAGAIRENQRSYDQAVREYARGAIAQPGSNAEQRLLLLARRPALRPRIEQLTQSLVSDRNPQPGPLQLRIALLRSENRRDDLEAFLLNTASRTTSLEVLTQIAAAARVDGFPKAQQASIEKQIALMTDPVEKMRLQLALARFEEGQGLAAQGAAVVDALYREHPAILGVVRAAVDYHWRGKDSKRAIDILEEASARSSAAYREPFLVEAARKAIDAGEYTRARAIVGNLQTIGQPDRPEYIALKAETYARQGDDRGLRTFYDTTIRNLSNDKTIPAQQRTGQIAAIRRSLIPVLTRVKDYSAAIDQYIEILNRFPDDDALVREAALYAQQNGVARKLHDFYAKTAADSPKEFHWPMILARVETQMEDYPSAVASYTRAAAIRPDRPELIRERLSLEERLLRFEDAATSAQKLYDLTYRNPSWMEKLAELRARQGRNADAMAALTKAWIDGRSDSAVNYLTAAQKLESWGMLPEALKFAEQAMKRAPEDAVKIWARILARQQQYEVVLARMPAWKPATAMQVAQVVAGVAATYSAADQAKFATVIEKQPQRIAMAETAGLYDLELKWRLAAAMARPGSAASNQSMDRIVQLQKSRLRFDELGAQLEAYDRLLPPGNTSRHEAEEAEVYRSAGDTASELRVLKRLYDRHEAQGPVLERYTQLLIARPPQLTAAIGAESDPAIANAMLNYVLEHASAAVSQQAITARGAKNGVLWTKAYSSLAGLYFASPAVSVRNAFTAILGPMSVGARIGKPTDRSQHLAGDEWFYYGSRYGEYLGATHQPGADDYLPASVEATPGRSEAYFQLAEYTGSISDYQNALELTPTRADVHDRLAVLDSRAGRTSDAVREWKLAIAAFAQMMDRSRVPQKFWPDLSDTLRHIGEAKQFPALHDDIEKILRTYIRRNGAFQIDGILESAVSAYGDTTAALNWVADLSRSAADPVQFLEPLIEKPWVPDTQRSVFYRQIVESAEARVSQTFGEQQANAENQVWSWKVRWATYLLAEGDQASLQPATTLLAEARKQKPNDATIVELEIRLAARTQSLAVQLAKYHDPLPLEPLRNAANTLLEEGDAVSSRRVLEFVYTNQMKTGNLDEATFLGLAEVRLEDKDTAAAMALLRRMVLISGEPFTGLDPAAALLERTKHPAEAAEFLATLIKAEPWNQDAKRRLSDARGSAPRVVNPWDTLPTEAAAKEKALLAIIAADPRPTAPKVLLARAALDAHHPWLASAVVRQLLPDFFREDGEFTEWVAKSFLPTLESSERAAIAKGLADAKRTSDPRAAFLYASIANSIAPSDANRRSVDSLRTQIANDAKNETRRPLINDSVDQDRLVRPKIGLP
jgi:Flp pilus assembly protein TadD